VGPAPLPQGPGLPGKASTWGLELTTLQPGAAPPQGLRIFLMPCGRRASGLPCHSPAIRHPMRPIGGGSC